MPEIPADEVREKLRRALAGDKQAKAELVEENMPLIKSVVRRYKNSLTEYEDEDKEEEVSSEVIGRGGSIGHLFDHAGYYVLRASLEVAEGAEPLTAELAFTVVAPAWKGSEAFIVPEDYLSSAAYIKGEDGAVPQETDLYGAGSTMTFGVTTLEDVEYESVYWYVDGTIAGTGRMFTYSPSGLPSGDHKITVSHIFSYTKFHFIRLNLR